MFDPLVAIVVAVPEEYFSDSDDVCLAAGKHVCARLESHLVRHGHAIADWIRGGCSEDWGVYFESECDSETFDYAICYFPVADDSCQEHMAVQYHRRIPFGRLEPEHHLHATMEEFGKAFSASRMLTQSELEAEY